MRVPIVGVSLLHRAGHFCQQLDEAGSQSELPVGWNVSDPKVAPSSDNSLASNPILGIRRHIL